MSTEIGAYANQVQMLLADHQADLAAVPVLLNTLTTGATSRAFKALEATRKSYMYCDERSQMQIESQLVKQAWAELVKRTKLIDIMSVKDKDEFLRMLESGKAPPFTAENIREHFGSYVLDAGNVFARKVDEVFRSLSGQHVTNRPEGFGKRIIMAGVFGDWCMSSYWRDHLYQFFQVVFTVLGRQQNPHDGVQEVRDLPQSGEWFWICGTAIKARRYINGNVHFELHPVLAAKLNEQLAILYPKAIPPKHRQKQFKSNAKVPPLRQKTLQPQTLVELKSWLDRAQPVESYEAKEVLETAASQESVVSEIIKCGYIPEKRSHQFYPTPDSIVKIVLDYANPQPDDTVLEPSVGTGNLIDPLVNAVESITAVEISAQRCRALESRNGIDAICGDFLRQNFDERFSLILMNPPFTRSQAVTHVIHALKFLAAGGRMVSVVPAGFDIEKLNTSATCTLSDVIHGEFDGVSIGVRILRISHA